MSLKGKAHVGAYRSAQWLSRLLPLKYVPRVSEILGGLALRFMGTQRMMLTRHMQRAAPEGTSELEIQAMVRSAFGSYARYYVESFHLTNLSIEAIDEGMEVVGGEPVFAALDDGRGAIVVVPHLGGWEWLAYWFTLVKGLPLTAVVEALEPPELFAWFRKFRQDLGMNVVPLGPTAGKEVAAALGRNEVVVLVSDRDLSGTGAEVEFFGETTTLPNGAAVVAMRTGAPIFPLAAYFDSESLHKTVVLAEIDTTREGRLREDAARITQDVANALEELIRRAPNQWHLLQPNWPSDHEWLSDQSS